MIQETTLKHKLFGCGKIVSRTTDTVRIQFSDGKTREFAINTLSNYFEEVPDTQEMIEPRTTPRVIYASTNADFLNKVFGTNYKGWRRCGWDYDPNIIVWMTPLDDKVRNGWINSIINENTVQEDFVGNESDKLITHQRLKNYRRIIVKKESKRYVILGLFKYDFENSIERNKRIWIKISDDFR